jgi:hypothetical protein
MDLLIICETVTADGSVLNDEVKLPQKWLVRNQGSTLPAVEFLTAAVERIVEDGRISHRAIRFVLASALTNSRISTSLEANHEGCGAYCAPRETP